jgi:hypothetical protein
MSFVLKGNKAQTQFQIRLSSRLSPSDPSWAVACFIFSDEGRARRSPLRRPNRIFMADIIDVADERG